MTWLITGGAGYIGAHVALAMAGSGREYEVLDDLSTGVPQRIPNEVEQHNFSLQDKESLQHLFSTKNFEGVLHLAAKKRVGESVERPDYYWQENVIGLENLFGAMNAAGVTKFVFSSSAAVYGQPEVKPSELITEDTPCQPINPYGATKLEGEVISRSLAESEGMSVAALRYFNVAGAGRPELGDQFIFNLVPIIFDAIRKGEQPLVFGDDYATPDGSCIRDYVHVQDLAEAHVSAMDFVERSGPGFSAINIGTGNGASVFEMLSMVEEVTGHSLDPIHAPRRQGDPAALIADVSLARKILNWESKRNLRDIVSSAWEAWNYSK